MKLRHKVLPAAAAVAGLLVSGCCTVPKAPQALLLHPLPPAEVGYTLSKGGLLYTGSSYRLAVRPVDWREMEECRVVTRRGRGAKMDASRHIFFAIRLENLSSAPLRFDPGRVETVTDKGVPLTAAGFGETPFIPAAGGGGRPIDLLSSPESTAVPSGSTMEGLFAYRIPSRAPTAVSLILNGLRRESAGKAIRFTFEAFPVSAEELP